MAGKSLDQATGALKWGTLYCGMHPHPDNYPWADDIKRAHKLALGGTRKEKELVTKQL